MIRLIFGRMLFGFASIALLPPMAFVQQVSGQTRQLTESTTAIQDGDHRLEFDFSSASWNDVLNWFAKEAKMNLEWRELPDGEFNLKTQRTYPVTEALDIINMHLLARGYTLLRRHEVLVLMKLDENFDTTLVPRIQLEDLDKRGSFDFVKVSFALDWLLAETTVKELSPMLSPHGALIPLSKTNRIEAMDSVSNLRAIRDLIEREESGNSQERLVSEFVLEYTNATEMIGKLQQLLGMEKPLSRMSNNQMQVVREQYAFKAELAKRTGENGPSFQESRIEVFLVVNEQRNSIVANAPPDKIAIIKQAIQTLDVPSTNQGAQLSEITTMKVYPLNGADPDAVSEILQDLTEIGELHPNSRFSEDDDKQILFAYASLKDHVTIMSVMNQLSGSSRSFKVVQLKRLKAAYVARSIQTLMGAEITNVSVTEGSGRRGRDAPSNSWKGFKVEADLPHNRLLLFATTPELAQVEELLIKIGERVRLTSNERVMKLPAKTIDETIELLRQQWPKVSDSPLEIQLPQKPKESADSSTKAEVTTKTSESKPTSLVGFNQSPIKDNGDLQEKPQFGFPEPTQEDRLASGPAIVLRKSADDELVISSKDPIALEQLESMLAEFIPENEAFKCFALQFASPYDVVVKLREVFGADGFGNPLPIKFIADETTHSILVLGAGNSELKEIQEIIRFYDKMLELDRESERKPRFFDLTHVDAATVVRVIKDLYRDYLSATDRELAPRNEERQSPSTSSFTKGLLSVGVSANVNTVVVSAPAYLTDEIAVTIAGLDVPDATTVIRTIPLNGGVDSIASIKQLVQILKTSTNVAQPNSTDRRRDNQDGPNQEQDRSNPVGSSQTPRNYSGSEQISPFSRSQQFPPTRSGTLPRR